MRQAGRQAAQAGRQAGRQAGIRGTTDMADRQSSSAHYCIYGYVHRPSDTYSRQAGSRITTDIADRQKDGRTYEQTAYNSDRQTDIGTTDG